MTYAKTVGQMLSMAHEFLRGDGLLFLAVRDLALTPLDMLITLS